MPLELGLVQLPVCMNATGYFLLLYSIALRAHLLSHLDVNSTCNCVIQILFQNETKCPLAYDLLYIYFLIRTIRVKTIGNFKIRSLFSPIILDIIVKMHETFQQDKGKNYNFLTHNRSNGPQEKTSPTSTKSSRDRRKLIIRIYGLSSTIVLHNNGPPLM